METKAIVFNVNDVSKKLSIAPAVVRTLLRTRKLKGFRIGSRLADWRVLSTDLKVFLADAYVQSTKRRRSNRSKK